MGKWMDSRGGHDSNLTLSCPSRVRSEKFTPSCSRDMSVRHKSRCRVEIGVPFGRLSTLTGNAGQGSTFRLASALLSKYAAIFIHEMATCCSQNPLAGLKKCIEKKVLCKCHSGRRVKQNKQSKKQKFMEKEVASNCQRTCKFGWSLRPSILASRRSSRLHERTHARLVHWSQKWQDSLVRCAPNTDTRRRSASTTAKRLCGAR